MVPHLPPAPGKPPPPPASSPGRLASFRPPFSTATSFAHALADSLPGIVYLFDNQARLLWWNQALERITGYDLDDLASAPISKFVPARDLQIVQLRFQLAMDTGAASIQTALVLKSGEEIPHLFTGHRMDFAGAPCLIGMGIDISDQVRAERRRAVRLAVPQLLAGAEDLAAVATPVLQTVGECLGWEIGAIWLVDSARAELQCAQIWQSPAVKDPTFAE